MTPLRSAPTFSAAANEALLRDTVAGLSSKSKTLPSALHWDANGSRLFEAILQQPEYHVARVETQLLSKYGDDMLRAIPNAGRGPAALMELGASDDKKASFLLESPALAFSQYIPVNIEPSVLRGIERHAVAHRPTLSVRPICTDFLEALPPPVAEPATTLVAYFPGATIGQLKRKAAIDLMKRVRSAARPWAARALIVTSDQCRDPARLCAAYDDRAGASAAFGLNLLANLNRLGDGDFDARNFRHAVRWRAPKDRVEMYLESSKDQECRFAGRAYSFAAGERILTAVSYKRTSLALEQIALKGGWRSHGVWTDQDGLVATHLFVTAP